MVRLLAGNLLHVVAIHSLGGSRANRITLLALHKGAIRTNTNEDPQATSNPLELSFANSDGE